MFKNYFYLVSKILKGPIYCDISREEIERHIYRDQEFDQDFVLTLTDSDGSDISVPIRLVIQKRDCHLESFSVALLLHNIRIACIDFERKFKDRHKNPQTGWHKHIWDESQNTADHIKESLPNFGSFGDVSEFLTHAFKELHISLSAKDYGTPTPELF